jgi:hypothetical protein
MAGITLEIAETKLASYLAAEEAILLGQSVERNGKKLTMADLGSVQAGVALWNSRVAKLSRENGGNATVEIIPR